MINFEGGLKEQINHGYELGMFKPLSDDKLAILEQLYHDTGKEWEQSDGVYVSVTVDQVVTSAEGEQNTEFIAMTAVANTILNLDEMLNN